MTTRRLYNDLSDEAHLPSTVPVLAELSVLVDCLEKSNLCVFVFKWVCVTEDNLIS